MLAILIIVNHSIGHGISEALPEVYDQNKWLLMFITTIGNPAVNCFFLISGFFGILQTEKSFKQIAIPVVLTAIISAVIGFSSHCIGIKSIIKIILFPWMDWWFVTAYLIMWLVAPYINAMVEAINVEKHGRLVIILLLIAAVQGTILQGAYWGNGFSGIHGITIYILGAYLKRTKFNLDFNKCFFVWLCTTLLIYVSWLILESVGINNSFRYALDYGNPLVVIQSVAVFIIFVNRDFKFIRKSVFQNSSKAVFLTYLITDSSVGRKFVYYPMLTMIERFGSPLLFILINA